MDLAGRRILVTGASSGIGRESAALLAELGAAVVLVGRDQARLELTATALRGSGHAIEPFDLLDTDAIPTRLKEVAQRGGTLSGLVHCAGLHQMQPLRIARSADFMSLMSVNVLAASMLAKGYRQKGVATGGSIVLLSSVMSVVGQPGVSAYAASKGALVALARSLALELVGEGIRVNCVSPGFVETEMGERLRRQMTPEQFAALQAMHPLGLGRPRDVANAVAFLLADTARWITGSNLIVDGGYSTP